MRRLAIAALAVGTIAPMSAGEPTEALTGALTGRYVSTFDTVAPCARSMVAVRAMEGAEDDLCAAWFGPRGRVIVGPMSAAPARAHWVGA